MIRVLLRQIGKIRRELQQHLEPIIGRGFGEIGDDLCQSLRQVVGLGCRRLGHQRPRTSPGSAPVTIGTPTTLPHSVQEPS